MNAPEKSTADLNKVAKDTRQDIHSAIDKVAEKVPPLADRVATSAHDGVDYAGDKIESVSGTVAERGKQLGAAYNRFADTGRGYVRSSPAVSLLVAAVAGYGLSKLLGARK